MDLTTDELRVLRMAAAMMFDECEKRALAYLPISDASYQRNQERAAIRAAHKQRAREAHALVKKLHAEMVARCVAATEAGVKP